MSNQKILTIEDDPAIRRGIVDALRFAGYVPIEADRGDRWDTGKVFSNRSTLVPYGGTRLEPGAEYCWKVRVWDQDGGASPWSPPATWVMGLLDRAGWKAEWIGAVPASEETYLPATYLRTEFRAERAVRRAVLHATAAGLYEFHINGQRVGEDIFTPGWTEYEKRLFYQTYDVTALLRSDAVNALGAILGDGWYGLHHGGRGKIRLLAQLELEYEGGATQVVATGPGWKGTTAGPIRMADFYQGESYDARLEMDGWNLPGFDDAAWKPVRAGRLDRDTWKDVTEQVKAALAGPDRALAVSNDLLGDPVRDRKKVLKAI